jgi:hypothetical protein
MIDTDSDELIYYSDEEENKCIEKYELTVWKAYNNFYGDLKFL